MAGPDDTDELHGVPQDDLEQRALAALTALRADRAPDRLRAEIERMRRSRPARVPRARGWRTPAAGLAAAAAAAAVALVVVLSPGAGAPSVLQAAALALRGPLVGAPAPDREAPTTRLDQSVEQIYFPNWQRFGWRATGQRTDSIAGRRAVTVYYTANGDSIAYTIVAMPPMPAPRATQARLGHTRFLTLHLGGHLVVTWRRLGHTCVLSGRGVTRPMLLKLAVWHPAGSDY